MITRAIRIAVTACLLTSSVLKVGVSSAESPPDKPPVGIPGDAIQFKGKWYRVYVERGGWKRAKQRCTVVGGRLAIVPDAATHAFIKEIAAELPLWLGATDEKVDGAWQWIDGTPMRFSAWDEGQPQNVAREHYLMILRNGLWHDTIEDDPIAIGFVCEWKRR
jgi:hypothetical protein